LGEAFLFQDGMSVADLMYKFVTHWLYTGAEENWDRLGGPGFCMHSDWVTGYFVNTYYLAQHSGDEYFQQHDGDRFRGWRGSEFYIDWVTKEKLKECSHDGDEKCIPESQFCHHVTPGKMRDIHFLNNSQLVE